MKALLVLLLLSVAPASQKHVPTIEQCRADATAWARDIHDPPDTELRNRLGSMMQCDDAYTLARPDVRLAEVGILLAIQDRHRHFIERHNLWEQYAAEDADGKR